MHGVCEIENLPYSGNSEIFDLRMVSSVQPVSTFFTRSSAHKHHRRTWSSRTTYRPPVAGPRTRVAQGRRRLGRAQGKPRVRPNRTVCTASALADMRRRGAETPLQNTLSQSPRNSTRPAEHANGPAFWSDQPLRNMAPNRRASLRVQDSRGSGATMKIEDVEMFHFNNITFIFIEKSINRNLRHCPPPPLLLLPPPRQ